MAEIYPIVDSVSIGNATVAIDCVWLKCIESVDIRLGMEEEPIECDKITGVVTTLRHSPNGEVTIMALNLNSTVLGYALDANVSVKAAPETVTCEEHQITWVPEDVATPTYWTAVVCMNSPEIASVNVWTDNDCSVAWEDLTPLSTVTITDACTGCVTLQTDDIDETDATLWFSYTHNTETPLGAELIKPPFSAFASDHKLHILHRNVTSGSLILHKFWRAQIIPDFNIRYDNTARQITIPIRMRILADALNHPDAPMGQKVIIVADDSEAADFTYDFYKKVRARTIV